ncbi:MAG: TonB family protein [Hyphomonadaceae bacterium]
MNDVLAALLEMNVAAAVAVGFILLVRRHAQRLLGPHAAYLLWSIVPVAILATFIPSRTITTLTFGLSLEEIIALTTPSPESINWEETIAPILMAAWITGMIVTAVALARRQAAFLRDASVGLAGPAIVGFSRPRIVTPDDFSRRYSDSERKLILTHEQVHLDRNDARVNALVALARCVFWFNPMIHAGAKTMRVDQELSCDAEVIDRRPRGVRRAYAETLLKTQLASRPLPVGCYWPAESQHPLTERIDMLARQPVSSRRRIAATAIVLVLSASAGIAAWAAQPERTVFREAPDVLVPFQPLKQDQQSAPTSNPRPGADFHQPDYPAEAAAAKQEGDVVVELCVGASGAVADVKLIRSSGYASLDNATVTGLEQSRLEPATRNGQAVSICGYSLTMGWRLGPTPPAAAGTP